MTNEIIDKTDEQRNQPWKKILELKHTHQQDGHNCGVFVSDWAEKMYKQGKFIDSMKKGQEKNKRKEIYDHIKTDDTQQKVTLYRKSLAENKQLLFSKGEKFNCIPDDIKVQENKYQSEIIEVRTTQNKGRHVWAKKEYKKIPY